MSHYFIENKNLKDDIKTIRVKVRNYNLMFKTNSGVFSKDGLDFGSRLLIETVEFNRDNIKIADVGCGYGPIGIALAKDYQNSLIFMYDINQKAIDLAIENADLNECTNVKVIHNNLLDDVEEKFDLIVTNPPIRAGKETVFKIYDQAFERLNDDGELYVVIQKKQGAPSSVKKLQQLFTNVEIKTKYKGYWILKAKK